MKWKVGQEPEEAQSSLISHDRQGTPMSVPHPAHTSGQQAAPVRETLFSPLAQDSFKRVGE